ncbi:MAG: PLP-dependent aminotransferase family protein [Firmicutes bacterium]|nr:PLP-dependent aminotransferase family protein [Bacillota bacterium]
MFIIDRKNKIPLYIQLYEQIKNDIISGKIKNNEKLESSRMLAENMNVSRNTTELAYEKLISEGFAVNRPRKGYYAQYSSQPEKSLPVHCEEKTAYDMREGGMRISRQMLLKWKQCISKALDECCVYSYDMQKKTDRELKTLICGFLYKHRKINCDTDNIVIFNGIQSCLGVLFSIIKNDSAVYFSDDDNTEKSIARLCGIDIVEEKDISGIYEYIKPFGNKECISAKDREKAAKSKNIIIENDTGYLFYEDHIHLPAIRAYNENVIYIGSFSDILMPAARISYMILPDNIKKGFDKISDRYADADGIVKKALIYFMKDKNMQRYFYRFIREEKDKTDNIIRIIKEKITDEMSYDIAEGIIRIKSGKADITAAKAAENGIMIEYDENSIILYIRALTKEKAIEAMDKLCPIVSCNL